MDETSLIYTKDTNPNEVFLFICKKDSSYSHTFLHEFLLPKTGNLMPQFLVFYR